MWRLVQYRDTIGQKDAGFELASLSSYKKVNSEAKAQFDSHLEMVMKHEYFGYDNWEVDQKNFVLRARVDNMVVYEYRLEIESPEFIGSPTCSVCGREVPYD